MTDPTPTNGNGCYKGMNRRAKFVGVGTTLGTVAYYVCILRGLGLDWFVEYAKFILLCVGLIVGGITVTDAITKWRGNGNGGTKP